MSDERLAAPMSDERLAWLQRINKECPYRWPVCVGELLAEVTRLRTALEAASEEINAARLAQARAERSEADRRVQIGELQQQLHRMLAARPSRAPLPEDTPE